MLFGLLTGLLVASALVGPGRAGSSKEAGPQAAPQDKDGGQWTRDFTAERGELSVTGRNPYFILEPGYVLVFKKGDEVITKAVLGETKEVDGVLTRVVEERETRKGKLVEVSRNYFAISKRTNSVYYFGEDVDLYEGGKVVGHEGAWLSGRGGARFGLMFPGTVLPGGRYYQELAPKVAMDRAEIVALNETVVTPAGTFARCVKVLETSPLEPNAKEHKYYAPGVGLVKDGDAELVEYGFPKRPKK
jgi:hypothetical protein